MSKQDRLSSLVHALRRQFPILADRYQISSLGLFGSYVRDEQQDASDLDVLVEFKEPPGLIRFIELENFLSDILNIKVDLVMRDALKPRIAQRVLAEVVMV